MNSELAKAAGTKAPALNTPEHPDGQTVRAQPVGDAMEGSVTMAGAASSQIAGMMQLRERRAMNFPRDWNKVHKDLMAECSRPGFAESAQYSLPRGNKDITGFTIRFAEAAARCMTNIMTLDMVVHEDQLRRVIRVIVLDLESNIDYGTEIVIDRTVERHNKDGRELVGSRMNSNGKIVYICKASEDEVTQKKGIAVSKAVRNGILKLLPADIADDAEGAIHKTLRLQREKSPEVVARKLVESFARFSVPEAELVRWLKCPVEKMTETQYNTLRGAWKAIADHETTWADFFPPDKNGANGVVVQDEEKKSRSRTNLNQKMLGDSKTPSASEELAASKGNKNEPVPVDRNDGSANDSDDDGFSGP